MQNKIHEATEWINSSSKYLIGILTVSFTIAVLPLFRLISEKNGSYDSKVAGAAYWVLSNIFGIGIILYPWWLATAKSPLYYNRLQYMGRILCVCILVLAALQGVFTPDKPFDQNDPAQTSLAFKITASLNTIFVLAGLLIVLPIFIRRDRLFKSKSLFRFAWAFTAIMLASLLIRRWSGFTLLVAYSCLFLVIQFIVVNYFEEDERKRSGKLSIFDEAYIIIAGE